MFCLHLDTHHVSAVSWLEEGIIKPGTGVIDGCEPPCGRRKPSQDPLEEYPVFLTTKPSLQPFNCCCCLINSHTNSHNLEFLVFQRCHFGQSWVTLWLFPDARHLLGRPLPAFPTTSLCSDFIFSFLTLFPPSAMAGASLVGVWDCCLLHLL